MIVDQALEGLVSGDTAPPELEKVVQNLYADETGATVDVRLSEPVDEAYLSDARNFHVTGPQSPVVLRASRLMGRVISELSFGRGRAVDWTMRRQAISL